MYHSHSKKSLWVVTLVAIGSLAAGRTVRGSIMETDASSSSQSTFDSQISSTDLINSGQTSLASAVLTAGAVNGGSVLGSHDGTASNGELDLSHDLFFGNTFAPGGGGPITLTFNLNTGVGGSTGYDLTGANLFYGWSSNPPFSHQIWTMSIETTAHPSTFVQLWSENYSPSIAGPGDSSLVKLTDTMPELTNGSVIATGVTAIQFILTPPNNSGSLVREIDVFGTATAPEPGSFVLLGLGLAGLAIARRSRRRAKA